VAELVVGGALVFAALMLLGVIWTMVSLVFWLVLIPFKLLGFLFKGVAALLLLPALPLVLLGLGIWWLMKRRHPPAATAP